MVELASSGYPAVVREAAFAVAITLLLLLMALVLTLPPDTVMLGGRDVMLAAGLTGIPIEVVYFAALGVALARRSVLPAGWYWRSFDHHHLLLGRERWIVLPWFYAGAVAFVICMLGIVVAGTGLVAIALRLS